MLRGLGYPVERTNEQAWPHFRGLAGQLRGHRARTGLGHNAPPALWSGPRRWPSTPMAPNRRPTGSRATPRRPREAPRTTSSSARGPARDGPRGGRTDRPGAAG